MPMPLPDAARSRVFEGLTDAERGAWLASASVRELEAGEILARQGEPAHAFYLVDRGLLKLVQITAEGRELIVRFVGPSEPFGGVVALDAAAYPVTARAAAATRVGVWPRDALRQLLDRTPIVRDNLMREMASHVNDALTRVRELTTERVAARLARALLRLTRQCGRKTPDGVLITHTLTRQDLADLTGTTLFTVSRTLAQWETDGILRSARRQLLVRSPERLRGLAGRDPD